MEREIIEELFKKYSSGAINATVRRVINKSSDDSLNLESQVIALTKALNQNKFVSAQCKLGRYGENSFTIIAWVNNDEIEKHHELILKRRIWWGNALPIIFLITAITSLIFMTVIK